jgi:hypothetical protein
MLKLVLFVEVAIMKNLNPNKIYILNEADKELKTKRKCLKISSRFGQDGVARWQGIFKRMIWHSKHVWLPPCWMTKAYSN